MIGGRVVVVVCSLSVATYNICTGFIYKGSIVVLLHVFLVSLFLCCDSACIGLNGRISEMASLDLYTCQSGNFAEASYMHV